jgi:hypothetical protein
MILQRHTNEMFEEKEEEFGQLAIRHAATEAYVEELRLRVAKLSEHESATEVIGIVDCQHHTDV